MNEPQDSTLQIRLRQLAVQLRKQTSQWLTNALQTDIKPKAEYARLVLAMQCNCSSCYCSGCPTAEEICNAA
ncbi:MAG: hypothetical protein SFV81_12985 [Pirellulaceae bacterium]|nr:hypothetical protein [Pirellulaceae bacterium]